MRGWWLRVHRWLALSVGLLLALIGLSGALLELKGPILRWEVGSQAWTWPRVSTARCWTTGSGSAQR